MTERPETFVAVSPNDQSSLLFPFDSSHQTCVEWEDEKTGLMLVLSPYGSKSVTLRVVLPGVELPVLSHNLCKNQETGRYELSWTDRSWTRCEESDPDWTQFLYDEEEGELLVEGIFLLHPPYGEAMWRGMPQLVEQANLSL